MCEVEQGTSPSTLFCFFPPLRFFLLSGPSGQAADRADPIAALRTDSQDRDDRRSNTPPAAVHTRTPIELIFSKEDHIRVMKR